MTGPNLPLEDVLHELIRAEPEPSYDRLTLWCKRYPQHRDALGDFFAIWGLEDFRAAADEEQPRAAAAVEYAFEQMRSRGLIPPADKVEPLEPFDRLVLTAIHQLGGRGHSVNITDSVGETTGASVLPASILVSVSSLEKRGLVWSRLGERRTGRDRKRTQYFTITLAGGRALGTSDVPKTRETRVATPARDFDCGDVEQEMMMEDPTPSYDRLVRWCGRYPQYSEELASFCLTWAVQNIRGGKPQELLILDDTERFSPALISGNAQDYALELLRRQGRLMPPPPIRSLEPFDRHVLTAVYQLRGRGTIASITVRVTPMTGARVLPASTSVSLNRMEKLGLVTAWSDDRETYFTITIGGKRALAKTR